MGSRTEKTTGRTSCPSLDGIFQPGVEKYRAVGSSANQINLLRDSSSEPDIFPFPHPLESPANRDVASNHTFQNKADLSSPPREQFKIS